MKNRKSLEPIFQTTIIFSGAALCMAVYEYLKELFFKGSLTPWESHSITIMVTSILAVVASLVMRKWVKEVLRIDAQKHQLLFESSRDALMTLAPPSWKFTGANQATLQLFGASSVAEFTALGPWNVAPERQPDGRPSSEKAQEMIGIAMRDGSQFFEWEHQRLDGQPFAADVLLTRMKVGEDVFLQATVRDISERKQAEQALRAAHEELLQKSGRLEKFQQVAVDREMRMVELKAEMNGLLERLGEPRKYAEIDRIRKR